MDAPSGQPINNTAIFPAHFSQYLIISRGFAFGQASVHVHSNGRAKTD
jgi:hypothetical protein